MTTKIEWTDETWNPLVGCEHVSPGCDGATHDAYRRSAPVPSGWAGMNRAGKKATGRELDGRTWDEYPTPA